MENDKVVLISGASSGIGAHLAKHLASVGYKNLCIVARTLEALNRVAETCRSNGAKDVLVLQRDLMDSKACLSSIQEAVDHFGRLDILVCNAGGTSSIGVKVRDLALNAMDLDLGLNFVAPFIMTKAALPHLQKTRGQILYISSPIATKPYIGAAAYCSSKAALEQFARVVALEEAPNGVRINVLSPGMTMSGVHVKAGLAESNDALRKEYKDSQPLGRVGEMEEISNLIEFLISEKNTFMVGSTITSDGGFLLK